MSLYVMKVKMNFTNFRNKASPSKAYASETNAPLIKATASIQTFWGIMNM